MAFEGKERRRIPQLSSAFLEELRSDIQEIKHDVRNIYHILHGDGDVGLTTKVDRNTQWRNYTAKVLFALFPPIIVGTIVLLIRVFLIRS